ncbi:hypothetical protein M8494_01020 [Serratia ureilytica]
MPLYAFANIYSDAGRQPERSAHAGALFGMARSARQPTSPPRSNRIPTSISTPSCRR